MPRAGLGLLWRATFVLAFVICVTTLFVTPALASLGDVDVWYTDCVWYCLRDRECRDPDTWEDRPISAAQDWILNLMRWTCGEDCRYECMRNHTAYRLSQGLPPLQYHGKWPFVRVLGTQEWFSSIFSIGNLLPAVWAFYVLITDKKCRLAPNRIRYAYISSCLTAMLAWICSAWFHARDYWVSEWADYFMADLYVGYGLALCFQRLFDVRDSLKIVLLHLAALAHWAAQVSYMAFVKFDYGWNTKWAVYVNAIVCLGWLIFAYKHRGKRTYVWKLFLFEILGWCAAMNELFDYPPLYDLLDAHAIWHGATMPLAALIWSFAIDDCRFEGIADEARHKID